MTYIPTASQFKKECNEYVKVKSQLEAGEAKSKRLKDEIQVLQAQLAQAEQRQANPSSQPIQRQKTPSNHTKTDNVQGQVLGAKISPEAHEKIGSALTKMIAGMETQLRPKLLTLPGHENLLVKLDSILGELKTCKETHAQGTDVSKETQAFATRVQTLGAEMNAFAKTAKK